MATQKSVMKWARIVFTLGIILSALILYYGWIGVFGRFLAFWMLVGMGIFGCILMTLFGPHRFDYRLEDWDDPKNQYHPSGYDKTKWNILLDTHFHTLYSDGWLTIEQAVKWHIACGFNAFFVTDHDTVDNLDEVLKMQDKYKDEILVIPGIEIGGFNGHLNVIGLKEWDTKEFGSFTSVEDIKNIVVEAHRQDALVTWNHFPWSYGGEIPRYSNAPSREDVLSWGIDFIEASNWDDDIELIDQLSYDFCMAHPEIAPVVGTDVHRPDKDKLVAWTLVNIQEFTVEALMAELRAKRTDVVFVPGGVPYPTQHSEKLFYRIFKPIYQIGDMFLNIHKGAAIVNVDKINIASWLVLISIVFVFLELLF